MPALAVFAPMNPLLGSAEQHHRIPDGTLAGRIGGTRNEPRSEGHRRRAATVEVDCLLCAQGVHNGRLFFEASAYAVAWLSAVNGDEEQVAARRHPGHRARVAPDTEAVVELGILGVDEALRISGDVGGSAAKEARAAVDYAGLAGEGCAVRREVGLY